MSSQNRAAHSHFTQLTLALDLTNPSAAQTRHRRPLTRRETSPHRHHRRDTVARIDVVIYAQTADEVSSMQVRWSLAGEETGVEPRVVPMQMCAKCERGFRAPEPGLCRDCRKGADA